MHGKATRTNRRAMEAVGASASAGEACNGAPLRRPPEDHQRYPVEAQDCGAPWRDLPERYGPWSTVYSRFFRWKRQGIWDQMFSALTAKADATGSVNWEIHLVDSTIIRAHQHAAGLKKGLLIKRRSATARAGSPPRST
jgi:hypothetical protein